MRLAFTLILLLIILVPVSGKTEVYIKLDKKMVAPEDLLRISVNVFSDIPSPIEVLITGIGGGQWLYENESVIVFSGSWDFRIPEDWEDGVYVVKVNLFENGATKEFFEQFRVIRPKILKVEFPELPYQGRTLVNVTVETPEERETSLYFKFIGLNFRFASEEEFKVYDNSSKLKLNLRQRYEETRDIDYALKPGIYAMELFLKYRGRIFDSRILTVEVVKPKLIVNVPEEVVTGEPIRIVISTNRFNDTYDGAYNGIVLTLVGENYKAVKVVELGENGTANVTMETAGLSKGDYKLYIRDTMLTYKGYSIKALAYLYYDLDPKDPKAKEFHAQDDIVIVKDLRIKKYPQSRSSSIIFFEPTGQEAEEGEFVSYRILLSSADNGLSAYELILYLSNNSVAEFYRIYFPEWAYETYKVVTKDQIRMTALDLKGSVGKDASRVEIASVMLRALSEGVAEMSLKVKRMDSDNGMPMNPLTYSAFLVVKPSREENRMEENNMSLSENKNGDLNGNSSAENEILQGNTTEISEEQNQSTEERSAPEILKNGETEEGVREVSKGKRVPKPKELGVEPKDIIIVAAFGATFVFVLGRRS
jgi:hypothetical protein